MDELSKILEPAMQEWDTKVNALIEQGVALGYHTEDCRDVLRNIVGTTANWDKAVSTWERVMALAGETRLLYSLHHVWHMVVSGPTDD